MSAGVALEVWVILVVGLRVTVTGSPAALVKVTTEPLM